MKNRMDNILARIPRNWTLPTEGKGYTILLTALLLTSFLLGIIWFFPTDPLKYRIENELAAQYGADVRIAELDFVFPLQMQFSNIRAEMPGLFTDLKIDSLRVKPVWSSLLFGRRAFSFSGRLNQGTAEGSVGADGKLALNLQQVRFSFPLSESGSLVLGGVAGDVRLEGTYPFPAEGESIVSAQFENLELTGLQSLGLGPEILQLGQFQMEGKGQGTILQVERLGLTGGAILVDGKGSIVFRQPVETSNLRLTATLKADSQLREIGELLALTQKPAADGSYQFRLIGTFDQPLLR
ncbi:MAG: type II secretion system protein GspN [Syntrophotaleaceae bacterium]